MVTQNLEVLIFQNVLLNASISDVSLINVVFLDHSVTTIGEKGAIYVCRINPTSNHNGTQLGTVISVSVVYQAVPQKLENKPEQTETDESRANYVCKIYYKMNLCTESKCISSSEFEFLSSTDASGEWLSEREILKCTDPQLLAPIPGPDSQLQIKNLWGTSFCESHTQQIRRFVNET